jgi:hypothetical protein
VGKSTATTIAKLSEDKNRQAKNFSRLWISKPNDNKNPIKEAREVTR